MALLRTEQHHRNQARDGDSLFAAGKVLDAYFGIKAGYRAGEKRGRAGVKASRVWHTYVQGLGLCCFSLAGGGCCCFWLRAGLLGVGCGGGRRSNLLLFGFQRTQRFRRDRIQCGAQVGLNPGSNGAFNKRRGAEANSGAQVFIEHIQRHFRAEQGAAQIH